MVCLYWTALYNGIVIDLARGFQETPYLQKHYIYNHVGRGGGEARGGGGE